MSVSSFHIKFSYILIMFHKPLCENCFESSVHVLPGENINSMTNTVGVYRGNYDFMSHGTNQ